MSANTSKGGHLQDEFFFNMWTNNLTLCPLLYNIKKILKRIWR